MGRVPESQAEIDTTGKFMAYQRGWEHAASGKYMDSRMANSTNKMVSVAYSLGYEAAGVAKNAALTAYATEVGYDIVGAILR